MNTNTHNANELSRIAGCYSPDDAFDSPGARFLLGVADACAEQSEYGYEDVSDAAHEIADSAVPVYTHERWQTFVDLGAYEQDISELGVSEDMTENAGFALYMIANTLAMTLLETEDE
jgi:hypothetical protein